MLIKYFLKYYLSLFILISTSAYADSAKPYQHDLWTTSSHCIIKDFEAYRSCFDDLDDDNGDAKPDALGVPQWVAYEMRHFNGQCIKTAKNRPAWKTDPVLFAKGIMPGDESYSYPKAFTSNKIDWFSRGHLAMKMHTERISPNAGKESFLFYNSVPQRQRFNAGIWQDLEDITSMWAQEYGAVWIIAGPIYADKYAYSYLGEVGELPVAIPDALFKIVIKQSLDPEKPEVLAFIYPQVGPGYYTKGGFDHDRYLTTIDEIEDLTGLDFLMSLNDQEKIETQKAFNLWPYNTEDFIKACQGSKFNE